MSLDLQNPLLALEHFKINCNIYHIILSDVRMPGMNGFEFVKMLKEINPKVIVLFMSAFDKYGLQIQIVRIITG